MKRLVGLVLLIAGVALALAYSPLNDGLVRNGFALSVAALGIGAFLFRSTA